MLTPAFVAKIVTDVHRRDGGGPGCGCESGTKRKVEPKSFDPITSARIEFALSALAASGKLKGARTARLSARIDPGLMQAARAKTGLNNDSELVNAALAVLAAPDDFGPWFAAQAGRLPKDFELEL
jgi:hypothetical protein